MITKIVEILQYIPNLKLSSYIIIKIKFRKRMIANHLFLNYPKYKITNNKIIIHVIILKITYTIKLIFNV